MLRFEGDLKARLAVKVAIIRHSKEDLRPSNVLRFSASSESAILTQHANFPFSLTATLSRFFTHHSNMHYLIDSTALHFASIIDLTQT